jgi:hypothetical protein
MPHINAMDDANAIVKQPVAGEMMAALPQKNRTAEVDARGGNTAPSMIQQASDAVVDKLAIATSAGFQGCTIL